MSQPRDRLQRDLDILAQDEGPDRLTIYFGRSSPDLPHVSTSLRSLVHEAASRLSENARSAMKARLEKELDELIPRAMARPALAIFQNQDELRIYDLPFFVPTSSHVETRFHLKPLFAGLTLPHRFYVLALSWGSARLLEVDDQEVRQLEFGPEVPTSLDQATPTSFEPQLQYHSGASADSGDGARGAAVYHTQPRQERRQDEDHRRYLAAIAEGCRELGVGKDTPLVLAGVDDVVSEFRKLAGFSVAGVAEGNVDHLDESALAKRARQVAEPTLREPQSRAKERVHELGHTDQVLASVDGLLRAARDGRVDTLLLQQGASVWGRFDPETREMHIGDDHAREDLLGRVALDTYTQGGSVFLLPEDEMPQSKSGVIGVLRY